MNTQQEDLPRLAIFSTVLGLPSEIWQIRQAEAFSRLDPVFVGWDRAESAKFTHPFEIIDGGFPTPSSVVKRIQRKLGLANAYRLSTAQKVQIENALRLVHPDIALIHFAWNAIPLLQVLPASLPVVLHVHGRDASFLLKEKAYRAALSECLSKSRVLIAVGSHQVESLRELGLPKRVEVIPCGAPTGLFSDGAVPQQPDPSQGIRFASVGRLSPEKGFDKTIQAFEIVRRSLPNCELVLIGDGPEMATLKQMALDLGLADAIRFTGHLSSLEIKHELGKSHIYLQHSIFYKGSVEGFGVTLAEACAVGLPAIVSSCGGLADQVTDDENGYLFPPADVQQQARLMIDLAKDQKKRQSMGLTARQMAKRYDSDIMSRKLEDVLLETL